MKVLIFVACSVSVCFTYPGFMDRIPNGDNVPNPCRNESGRKLWPGVGHSNIFGRGQLNRFGKDFMDSFYTYTESLCQKDSDGDGRSNGEELGDPNCTWYYSSPQKLGPATGHPGICEPMDTRKCKRKNKKLEIIC